jgi:hypothetical protein
MLKSSNRMENDFAWMNDDTSHTSTADSFAWIDDDSAGETPNALDNSIIHTRQVSNRRTMIAEKEQNLARLVTELPPPDTDLYIVGNAEGREHSRTGHITAESFDFGSFVGVCIDLLLKDTRQAGGVELYVSTWVLNRDTVQMFADNLDAGRLSGLHVIADKFLKRRHTAAVYAQLVEVIQTHPPSRILLAPNHCKILCMSVAGRYVTITGSANLSAVARTEQYNLTTSPDIHDFFVTQFFEAIYSKKPKQIVRQV